MKKPSTSKPKEEERKVFTSGNSVPFFSKFNRNLIFKNLLAQMQRLCKKEK
jgi:hypothetical protein